MNRWKGKRKAADKSETKQLHFIYTLKPKHYRGINEDKKKSILEYQMFLKEKKDVTIKGRTVAGGNKQRDFITKKDSSSPTVSTESVILSCIIDSEEKRDVAVIDTPIRSSRKYLKMRMKWHSSRLEEFYWTYY